MFLSNGQVIPAGTADRLGDRTPIFADANYYAASSLPLLNSFAAYAAIYKSQLWVGTVVRKLAMATARMPFEVKRRVTVTDSVNEDGNLADLLARPNRHMSGFQLWEWTSSTRDVYGEAFWLKFRDQTGRVRELHPMHPTNVIVKVLPDGSYGYVYSNGSVNTSDLPVIPEDDVVAFTTYNPDNLTRGLSTLEALRMTLVNEDAARRATAAMWAKGARPSMIMTTEQSLSPGASARLKAQFDAAHAGADATGSTVVFEEGIKAQVVQLSSEEMQYIESRKLNREEVCAAFDVPPPVVHILDHATFSNITEQLRSQYRDTMAPRFVNFESVIDHQLVPDFYPDRDVFTRFNMEEVLRGDFETKATATVALRNNGIASGNEIRSMFGLPKSDDPEMDRIFANAALAPLGDEEEQTGTTVDAGELVATPVGELAGSGTSKLSADEITQRVNAASALIRSGFAPEGALAAVGLDPIEHLGLLPVTVQKPLDTTEQEVTQDAEKHSTRQWLSRSGRAKHDGATTKTWQTHSSCVAHATLDGRSVAIDTQFPGGLASPDGCACSLTFDKE